MKCSPNPVSYSPPTGMPPPPPPQSDDKLKPPLKIFLKRRDCFEVPYSRRFSFFPSPGCPQKVRLSFEGQKLPKSPPTLRVAKCISVPPPHFCEFRRLVLHVFCHGEDYYHAVSFFPPPLSTFRLTLRSRSLGFSFPPNPFFLFGSLRAPYRSRPPIPWSSLSCSYSS